MRLAVSNIAWSAEEDDQVARAIVAAGVDAIEVAPTRIWRDPSAATEDDARAAAASLADSGLETVSFQSLLFGRPDLMVFGEPRSRAALVGHVLHLARLAAAMGARRMVFGSPRNRNVPLGMSSAEAFSIAVEVFTAIGRGAAASGTMVCIEPNPPSYGCDFVTTASEGVALVDAVGSPGFGLHLDVAGLTLAGDEPGTTVRAFGSMIRHVHASAPALGDLDSDGIDHADFGAALREVGYEGIVSIEMRSAATGANARRVSTAIAIAQDAYRS